MIIGGNDKSQWEHFWLQIYYVLVARLVICDEPFSFQIVRCYSFFLLVSPSLLNFVVFMVFNLIFFGVDEWRSSSRGLEPGLCISQFRSESRPCRVFGVIK